MKLYELFDCADEAARLTTPRRRVELVVDERGIVVRGIRRSEGCDAHVATVQRLRSDIAMDDDRAAERLNEMIRDVAAALETLS